MRVSVDEHDAGYTAWQKANATGDVFDVFLDGNVITHVITADEENGVVVRSKIDADGFVIPDETGEDVLREMLSGTVRIQRRAA